MAVRGGTLADKASTHVVAKMKGDAKESFDALASMRESTEVVGEMVQTIQTSDLKLMFVEMEVRVRIRGFWG